MNNSDFTTGCKSCFIYLRGVLPVSWCGCEARWASGCLAEPSSLIQEHVQEAWFMHDGLPDFDYFTGSFHLLQLLDVGPGKAYLKE